MADGGGALYINHDPAGARCLIRTALYRRAETDDSMDDLADILNRCNGAKDEFAAIFAGVPAGCAERGEQQLASLHQRTSRNLPIFRYRKHLGEFASASAIAAVLAVACMETGVIPGTMVGGEDMPLNAQRLLVLGTGHYISAVEISRP